MPKTILTNDLLETVQSLKQKEWVDLTHTFGQGSQQNGTYIDELIHYMEVTRDLDRLNLKELVLPLVVIDKSKEVEVNHDFSLTVADILSFEAEHGEIEEDTFVALRTDWSKRWPDKEAFSNQDAEGNNRIPGWGLEALKFLFEERKVKAIGHETFETDAAINVRENGALLGEYYILEQDTYQIELLTNLDKVPAKGAVIFNIVPKPENAFGFPFRSFAILP